VALVLLALLAIAATAVAGCRAPSVSQEDAVKATITRYDRLLAEGYRSMDMSGIRAVAEELQAEDEYIHMSALGEGGVRLLPTLKKRTFLSVSIESTSATVETRETWDYVHEDRTTHETVLVQRGLVYELAWDLSLHGDGLWYVKDVRSLSATTTTPPERFGIPTPGAERF
jgi:hypothetical protein